MRSESSSGQRQRSRRTRPPRRTLRQRAQLKRRSSRQRGQRQFPCASPVRRRSQLRDGSWKASDITAAFGIPPPAQLQLAPPSSLHKRLHLLPRKCGVRRIVWMITKSRTGKLGKSPGPRCAQSAALATDIVPTRTAVRRRENMSLEIRRDSGEQTHPQHSPRTQHKLSATTRIRGVYRDVRNFARRQSIRHIAKRRHPAGAYVLRDLHSPIFRACIHNARVAAPAAIEVSATPSPECSPNFLRSRSRFAHIGALPHAIRPEINPARNARLPATGGTGSIGSLAEIPPPICVNAGVPPRPANVRQIVGVAAFAQLK